VKNIFLKIYSIIKIIIEECLIDASQTTFININNEIANTFFNYFFTELINISNTFLKNFESLINDSENATHNLTKEIFDIFNLLLPYKEQYKLLTKIQINQLFENNLNLLIYPNFYHILLKKSRLINDDYIDERSNYEKNEVAIDYNAGFTAALADLIQFGYGNRDPFTDTQFDRAWPN
jgi:hypothetical protein